MRIDSKELQMISQALAEIKEELSDARAEIKELRAELSATKGYKGGPSALWLSASQAAAEITRAYRDCGKHKLTKLRSDGYLRKGYHYKVLSKSGASRPDYGYNAKRIVELLKKPKSQWVNYSEAAKVGA